jgi:hypothetical protein
MTLNLPCCVLPVQLHAAAPHQALLARFSTALSQITGWRLLIIHSTAHSHSSAPPQGAVSITPHLSNLSLHQPSDASSNSAAAASSSQSSSACHSSSADPSSSQTAARSPSSHTKTPADGHPAPLTLQALQSGGWVCGCVMMQQQEQSCWVRFNLPHELSTEADVAEALQQGRLVSTILGA